LTLTATTSPFKRPFSVDLGAILQTEFVVPAEFRGPPGVANGGYTCGLMTRLLGRPATVMLRGAVPLGTSVKIAPADAGAVSIVDPEGKVVGSAKPIDPSSLPTPLAPVSLDVARQAASASPFGRKSLHPGCFCCSLERAADKGQRAYVGQVDGAAPGVCAGVWTPDAAFADADGTVGEEYVWTAMDCPGSMAWGYKIGDTIGLLGSMSGELIRRPRAGQQHVMMTWALEAEGRKHYSGVALYTGEGELLMRGHQVWIAGAVPSAHTRMPALETAG
jgi:hypothetical protein